MQSRVGIRTRCAVSANTSGGRPDDSGPKSRLSSGEKAKRCTDSPPRAPYAVGLTIGLQRRPHLPVHKGPVVQTGTLQVSVINNEAQRLDQMKLGAGTGAEPCHVARVRRYLRMVENDMEHGSRIKKRLHRSEDARKDGGKRPPPYVLSSVPDPPGPYGRINDAAY